MVIGIFPIILGIVVILIFLLIWSAKKIANNQTGRPFSKKHFILFLIFLVFLYAIYCFYLLVKIGLLHGSTTLKAVFPLQCFLSLIVMVVFPASSLVVYRLYRPKLPFLIAVISFFMVLFVSLFYFTPGVKAIITDEKKNPVAGAFVFYYKSRSFLFSNWSDFMFIRTDNAGHFSVPRRFHVQLPFENHIPFCRPFMQGNLDIAIYAPKLHNYSYIQNAYDWSYPAKINTMQIAGGTSEKTIILYDLRDKPEYWHYGLFRLFFTMPFASLEVPESEKQQLTSSLKEEYYSFVSRYGNTLRDTKAETFLWPEHIKPAEFWEEKRPWNFFLQKNEFGKTYEERLLEIERQFNPALRTITIRISPPPPIRS